VIVRRYAGLSGWLDAETRFIAYLARRRAAGDEDLADDLVQLARVTLWELDVSRFTRDDRGWVRRQLSEAIREAWRALTGRH
jgi:hypothetical protein